MNAAIEFPRRPQGAEMSEHDAEAVDERLLGSWRFYRSRPMNDEERRAARMLAPLSAPLGLTEWKTTDGRVYAKGANAVSAQVGINNTRKEPK